MSPGVVTTHDVPLVWSDPGDLTDAARGEPEHVLHQAVPVGVESHQLLLDKLLTALGAQPRGHGAQAAAVVRAEIGDIMHQLTNIGQGMPTEL